MKNCLCTEIFCLYSGAKRVRKSWVMAPRSKTIHQPSIRDLKMLFFTEKIGIRKYKPLYLFTPALPLFVYTFGEISAFCFNARPKPVAETNYVTTNSWLRESLRDRRRLVVCGICNKSMPWQHVTSKISNKNGDRRRLRWNTCLKSLGFLAMNEGSYGVAAWSNASAIFPFHKSARERAENVLACHVNSRGRFGAPELHSGRVFPGRSRCR